MTAPALREAAFITSVDELSDSDISNSVFYVYFNCDSDALPELDRIVACGGTFVPHLHFGKTDYRFVNRHALNALTKTHNMVHRLSSFNLPIHENICEALDLTRNVEGDYVEIGVFLGSSALTALNYLDETRGAKTTGGQKKAWLLDTFDGFSYQDANDSADSIWAGTHKLYGVERTIDYVQETLQGAVTERELIACNICEDDLPSGIKSISVANIDVDLYEATFQALNKVSPKISPGGVIICEDPASTPGLYGALLAMEKFLVSEHGAPFTKIFKGGSYFLMRDR